GDEPTRRPWSQMVMAGAPRPTALTQGEHMLKDMTRSRLIQIWFAAIAVIVVASIAFGASVTVGTAAMLSALCLVPPGIVLLLWHDVLPPTIAQLLHDVDRDV